MLAYLLQIDAVDPATGGVVVLRASSVDDDRVCGQNGERWWPAIAQLPALRYDLFDGGFAGRIDTPQSSLTLSTTPFPTLPALMLADARVQLWSVVPGSPFSYLRFDGRCLTQPTIKDGLATLSIAVDDRWLDQPLLGTYAGTGGIEGDPALRGGDKPLALGAPRFVPGKLINSVDNVFQISSAGRIEAVETAMERLASFGAPSANYADYAALVAASIPAGSWATCLTQGLVRFGAPPAGKISFHVHGDKAGPDGWVRLPGRVIKRLALMAGGEGRINEASLAALDVARPWTISPYVESQITARELIQRIAASVNAVAGVTWTGQLFVTPVQIGTADVVLDATGASLPATLPLEQLEMAPPYWRLAIEAERTWAVHGLSDVAFTAELVLRGIYDPGETYREGHIVDMPDGSSWLYVNITPTSGNAPPQTGTGDDYWVRQRAPGGQDGLNSAPIFLYQRSATIPPLPSADATYTFATKTLTGHDNGWSQTIPAGSDPLYVTTAVAASRTETDTVPASEWAAARVMAQNGADGSDGDDGAPGTDGADGADGDDGAGLVANPVVVSCNSLGVPLPGELPKPVRFILNVGGQNVSAFAAWSQVSITNGQGNHVGNGLTFLDEMSADTATLAITATYEGSTYTSSVQASKVRAGSDAQTFRQDITVQPTTSYSPAGTLQANVFPNTTIEFSVSAIYGMTINGSGRVQAKLMYRNISDGGAWTQIGAEQIGSDSTRTEATPGEPNLTNGSLGGVVTMAGPSEAKLYEFRIEWLRTNSLLVGAAGIQVSIR